MVRHGPAPHDYTPLLLQPLTCAWELLVVVRHVPLAKVAAVQRHEEEGHGRNVQHLVERGGAEAQHLDGPARTRGTRGARGLDGLGLGWIGGGRGLDGIA